MNEILLLLSTVGTFGILGFGFLFGLKHAIEADHLAAVSTLVSERKSLLGSAIVGGLWGLGHTISLFLAGIFVLVLNFEITERTAGILEFCVGVMLVLLGLNVLRKIVQGGTLHFHSHEHGGHPHAHPHIHEHGSVDEKNTHHGFKFSPRSLIIGMIHGLAGSAGMMLLYLTTIETQTLKLIYILVFGIGSIAGMMIMSFLVGLPFHFTVKNLNRFNSVLQAVAGFVSVGIGLYIIYEKGIVEGLIS